MKRFFVLLLSLSMLLSLAACVPDGNAAQTEAPSETETTTTAPSDTEVPTQDTPSTETQAPTEPETESATQEPETEEPSQSEIEEPSETEPESESTSESETVPPTCTEPPVPTCAHEFSEATCTAPATCTLCGETQGEKLAHEYSEPTCTQRPTCIGCGKKRGSNLGHNYGEDGKCIRCDALDSYYIKKEGITRVAFIGDSITAGGYWKDAAALLGKKFEFDGFGVSGSTAYAQGLDGNPPVPLAYIDQPAYQKSLRYNPDVVVIMLGTNDSKSINTDPCMSGGVRVPGIKDDGGEQYKQDVIALIRSYQALEDAPQVFIALPPTSFRPENGGISNVNIEELIIPLLTAAAEETGALIIDTHTATENASEAFPDGVHPNADGKALLLQTVTTAILEWKASLDAPTQELSN